jgi:hypothetical protein
MGSMRLIRSEDLDTRLTEILERAAEVGREAETAALGDREPEAGEISRAPSEISDEQLLADLRKGLEDEVLVARPAQGEAVIDEREEHREIAKRALIHIKLPQLRVIAEDIGLPKGGKLEDVADRIVRAYDADEEEIARLIVAYETEPPPQRRFTTRLFRISDSLDASMDATADRIRVFAHRYVKTGIARWFVIENVDERVGAIRMRGTYRFYNADAELRDDEYRLRAERASASGQLTLLAGRTVVDVETKGVAEGRAMMDAFAHASGIRRPSVFSLNLPPLEGELAGWDSASVFMTDVLNSQFRTRDVEIANLVMVGFEMGEQETSSARPTVRSVRFQGQHLLDSQTACELLTRGQRMTEWTAMVRFCADAENTSVLPVTVRLERDHLAVVTGFGAHSPTVARQLHKEVVRRLGSRLEHGVSDRGELYRVADQIRARAEQPEPVERATIFGPATVVDDVYRQDRTYEVRIEEGQPADAASE